jgi:hypothetical protein
MEAGAHDWVLPVMSAHVQAARNVSLFTNGSSKGGGGGGGGGGGSENENESVGTLLLVSRRSCWRQVGACVYIYMCVCMCVSGCVCVEVGGGGGSICMCV